MRRVVLTGALLAGIAMPMMPAGAADHSVAVVDSDFEPADVTIAVGDAVVWTHQGAAPHTVTAADGSFDSHPQCNRSLPVGCMGGGQTFRREFAAAGTVAYYCKIHGTPEGGGMAGTITVTAPAGGGAATAPPPTSPPTSAPPETAPPATEASDRQSAAGGPDPTLQPTTTLAASSTTGSAPTSTVDEPGDEPVTESAAAPGDDGRGDGDDVWPVAGLALALLVVTGGAASTVLAIRVIE